MKTVKCSHTSHRRGTTNYLFK